MKTQTIHNNELTPRPFFGGLANQVTHNLTSAMSAPTVATTHDHKEVTMKAQTIALDAHVLKLQPKTNNRKENRMDFPAQIRRMTDATGLLTMANQKTNKTETQMKRNSIIRRFPNITLKAALVALILVLSWTASPMAFATCSYSWAGGKTTFLASPNSQVTSTALLTGLSTGMYYEVYTQTGLFTLQPLNVWYEVVVPPQGWVGPLISPVHVGFSAWVPATATSGQITHVTMSLYDITMQYVCGTTITIQISSVHHIIPGDYDDDGKSDVAVWQPSNGTWYLIDSSTGAHQVAQWGLAGDVPVPGDYDGDGKTDLAVWRPSTGTWYVVDSSNGTQQIVQWGLAGDVPVPGDYDGDGKIDLAVWRPSTGTWYVLYSSNGTRQSVQWGLAGDNPVPGDYDGDGKTDLAVWRPSTGSWYILDSSNGTRQIVQWGLAGDNPVSGDYDGDGKTDLAVWRPSTGTWYILDSSNGTRQIVQWGLLGDVPLP